MADERPAEGFGAAANVDIDKLLGMAQNYAARSDEMQRKMAELVGHAESEDRRVAIDWVVTGVSKVTIDPRALRMAAADLSTTVKDVIQKAMADLQAQVNEVMSEVFGEGGLENLEKQRDAAKENALNAVAAYNRTLEDAFGEFDQIRKRLDL